MQTLVPHLPKSSLFEQLEKENQKVVLLKYPKPKPTFFKDRQLTKPRFLRLNWHFSGAYVGWGQVRGQSSQGNVALDVTVRLLDSVARASHLEYLLAVM